MASLKASRRFVTLSAYSDPMALPENWSESSLSIRSLTAVVSWATSTWPGTRVSVVAMSGMGVLKKRPPASVVRLRSRV
jgi:hypothetical protein